MREFNETTLGLLKAAHNLTAQANKPPKKKYQYEKAGTAIHAARCLKKKERDDLNFLLEQIRIAAANGDTRDVEQLLKDVVRLPVKFVPVKRQLPIDLAA